MDKVIDIEVTSMKEVDFSGLKFPQIVLYRNPDDDPEVCVARVFDNGCPTNVMMRRETIWELQYDINIHTNMVFVSRCKEDLPAIAGMYF